MGAAHLTFRDRSTLHKNDLEAFKDYLRRWNWTILPTPKNAVYEVLRIRKNRPDLPPIIFYAKNRPTAHITVSNKMGYSLVKSFIAEKRKLKGANNVEGM